jgi:hypothetical protein
VTNATQTRLFASEWPKRPDRFSDSVAKRAAESLCKEVRQWLGDDAGSNEEIVADLVHAMRYVCDDGYEISRRLEGRGYSPDSELVDILDSAGHHKYLAHKEDVKEWVLANDLKLDLPLGTRVSVEMGGKTHIGEIRDRYEDTVQYSVFIAELGHVREGAGTHGVILGFEKVKAV